MNDDWWASPTEAYIYNEFADALREGFRLGVLHEDDLLGDDETVLARLRSASSPLIAAQLARITHFQPADIQGYVPRIVPKVRRIDPPVAVGTSWRRRSELAEDGPAYNHPGSDHGAGMADLAASRAKDAL